MQILRIIWAAPWTMVGLFFGAIGLMTGGACRNVGGVLEFSGGLLPKLLRQAPIPGGAAAISVGHTILGRTQDDLDRCREHERVHVRQYERWGLFFVPAYFGWSVVIWFRRGDPYLDNPFEKEAYAIDDAGSGRVA